MEEPVTNRGAAALPNEAEAAAVVERATDAVVVGVEWHGRRRLPPEDLDVVVYRTDVERAPHGRYYVVLADGAARGDGPARVLPDGDVGSVTDAVATFQADRDPDLATGTG